jgi:hypothetical protein
VPGSVISLNPSVADVRALRATAYLLRAGALTLVLILPVIISAGVADRTDQIWMTVAALVLWVCAVLLERRVTSVAILLAIAVIWVMGLGVFETLRRTDDREFWRDIGTLAGLCLPAWLTIRAVRASRRLARRGRRPRRRASTLHKLAYLPRDARLVQSIGPFAAAYAIWAVGAVAGLAVAAAVPGGHAIFGSLAFLPFALAGGRMFDSGRRRLLLRLDEVRAMDVRPPLLLLRSFADDNLPLERRLRILGSLLQAPFTLEELIVDRLWAIGPVMAIGRPQEALSPVGAPRGYVADAVWHERLLSSLDESAWVVGILGDSEGVMWEFRQVDARGAAGRFILIFPPHPASVLVRRWQSLSRSFPAAAEATLPSDSKVGLPLAAVFPPHAPPVLYCSKHRNETAYDMVLEEIFRTHLER